MTRAELQNFMQKIKANYQEFSVEKYVIDEWYNRLKNFDLEDVNKKLEKHLHGEYRKAVPRLNFIVDGLKTPAQKEAEQVIRVKCSYCGCSLELKDLDRHVARHNSIEYIKSREHYLGEDNNREELMNLTEVYFEKFYKQFLNDLYCVIEDGTEKERIEKLIFEEGWQYT